MNESDSLHDLTKALAPADLSELALAMLECAPDAIIIADSKGRIVLVNGEAENLLQYNRRELIGQAVEILMPERFREKHVAHREHYTDEPRLREMGANLNLFCQRKDGSEKAVQIKLSPVTTTKGQFIITILRRKKEPNG